MTDTQQPDTSDTGETAEPSTKTDRRPIKLRQSREAKEARRNKKIIELKVKGVELPAIAAASGVSLATVKRTIQKFGAVFTELEQVQEFRAGKSDILDAALLTFLKSAVSRDKLDKASVNNLAYAARQVHDMGRLERGQSTANVSTNNYVRIVPGAAITAAPEPDLTDKD